MAQGRVGKTVVIAVALVAGSSAVLAQHSGHAEQSAQGGQTAHPVDSSGTARVRRVEGRLISETEDSLTIEAVEGNQPVRLIYSLDQFTEFRGGVRVGSQVTVTYTERGGTRTATRVEGRRRRRGC